MIGTMVQGTDWLREQVDSLQGTTDRPFGIGFIQWVVDERPEMWDEALRMRPQAMWLSFGAPEVYIEKAKMAGIKVIYQTQTVELAHRAARAGADAIVAQGTEAGGHTGGVSTLPLVPAVVDAVRPVPVLAAGGIADGRGIAAALMLGAEGVCMGTRFAASAEAAGHANTKQRIVAARSDETVLTHVFDIALGSAWPQNFAGRALRNDFTERWHGQERELEQSLQAERATVAAAMAAGDTTLAPVYAGEASGLIHDVQPAAEIIQSIFADAEAILRHRTAALLGNR
jgi:nitronate monooxygenase